MRPKVLYVTDLSYPARGRRYCDEDIYLTSHLRSVFDLALCNPRDTTPLMPHFDTVVIRNSGPVIDYPEHYETFRTQAKTHQIPVYNPMTGKADMAGKQYLVDLTKENYPVIPTIDRPEDLAKLPTSDRYATDRYAPDRHATDRYVIKPKAGADSHGLKFVTRAEAEAEAETTGNILIQPKIDFRYEVSFYFVDHEFQYALHAPDPAQRWELTHYDPTPEDLDFAQKFIAWNDLPHGIQRVDACRTQDGELLLVELEDLNPYLSLDRVPDDTRARFVQAMTSSIRRSLN